MWYFWQSMFLRRKLCLRHWGWLYVWRWWRLHLPNDRKESHHRFPNTQIRTKSENTALTRYRRALGIASCVAAASCRINSLFIAQIIRLPILVLLLDDCDYGEFSFPSFVPHSTHTVYWQRLIFFCHVLVFAPICCDVPSVLLRCFFSRHRFCGSLFIVLVVDVVLVV